jgi:hypothetical protein
MTMFLLSGCIREIIYADDDSYTPFPEAEILGASFYYQRDGRDVTGDDAGMITKNKDGTYKVRMKRRSPSTSPTAMFITGPFEFAEFYRMVCTFPDDKQENKPFRVYACASVGMDGNDSADYPTAVDLVGGAAFRNEVAIGTFEMTNLGINYLNPDPSGQNRPYITMFLYLYFQNVGDPDNYYEFQLDYVGGTKGKVPESVVTKAEVYRAGDTANKFSVLVEEREVLDQVLGTIETKHYLLARYDHRFDSRKMDPPIPVLATTGELHIDLQVPAWDAGKEIEFEVRNAGLYAVDSTTNLITRTMNQGAVVEGVSPDDVKITEIRIIGNPITYRYRIQATTRTYDSSFTGVRLVIPGTAETFTNIDRFSCTLFLPEKFGWTTTD